MTQTAMRVVFLGSWLLAGCFGGPRYYDSLPASRQELTVARVHDSGDQPYLDVGFSNSLGWHVARVPDRSELRVRTRARHNAPVVVSEFPTELVRPENAVDYRIDSHASKLLFPACDMSAFCSLARIGCTDTADVIACLELTDSCDQSLRASTIPEIAESVVCAHATLVACAVGDGGSTATATCMTERRVLRDTGYLASIEKIDPPERMMARQIRQ